VSDVHIGDTITLDDRPCDKPLPGFKEFKPVVFSSIYPIAPEDYEDLAVALEKYKLNDAPSSTERFIGLPWAAAFGADFSAFFISKSSRKG